MNADDLRCVRAFLSDGAELIIWSEPPGRARWYRRDLHILWLRLPSPQGGARCTPPSAGYLEKAVVQISGVSEKRRIYHYIIALKGLPSKQRAQWYL